MVKQSDNICCNSVTPKELIETKQKEVRSDV